MDRVSPALQLRHPTTLIAKPSHRFVSAQFTVKLWCAARAPKHEEAGSENRGPRSTGGEEEAGLPPRKRTEMSCGRRRVLAIMAWPLLIQHSVALV